MAFDMSPILDNLPEEIKFLAEPVRRYRVNNGEEAIEEVVQKLTPEQLDELKKIGKQVYDGRYYHNQIARFLYQHEDIMYKEYSWLYFFFGLLDELNIKFDRPDDVPMVR